jgi:hypothetical protein
MSDNSNDIDLSSLSKDQALAGLGDMVLSLLSEHRVAILVQREDGIVTFVNPTVICRVPEEEIVQALIDSWDDDEIAKLLGHIYG